MTRKYDAIIIGASEWPVWETDLHNPSFAAFTNLCGGKGFRATKPEQLETALGDALQFFL